MIPLDRRDLTVDEWTAIRRALGVARLSLVLQPGGVYLATASTVKVDARPTTEDTIAVGAGVDATDAIYRALAKFRARTERAN